MTRRLDVAVLTTIPVVGADAEPVSPQTSQDEGPTTYATRGLAIGALAGGLAGGLGFGLMASALCQSGSCDNAFPEGFVIGLAGGAVIGGLGGAVIGSAVIRRDGEGEVAHDRELETTRASPAAGTPFSVGVSVGPGWGSGTRPDGRDIAVSLLMLANRPPPVAFGMELGYLGRRNTTFSYTVSCCGGGEATTTQSTHLVHASLAATRTRMLEGGDGGIFLLGSAGLYSHFFDSVTTGTSALSGARSGTTFHPGVGLGAGGAATLWGDVGAGFDTRAHLLIGQGDGFSFVVSAGGTLWRMR